MNTNFFQQIAALDIQGQLRITIAKSDLDTLTVSLLLVNEQCGDDARMIVPPLILRGSGCELDEGFFANIKAPLQTTSQLFVNMDSYLTQQQKALAESQMKKEQEKKEQQQKSERDKKFTVACEKSSQLEAEGKFREAWSKVPDPALFPEHAEQIRKRRSELSLKFEQTSLF
ncbi:prtrc system protein e [Dyadobacter luteus]|uniref:Prtrc system protein e n=2 Tax=Dyadobacter luteus TaxID=2259619 RepID=A0A3D8YFH1_9BACT|nr:prtrc system protein e [Dyadobacter luteus]